MVGEGVAEEMDVLAGNLAGENVAILLLAAAEELEGVGPKLQSTTQVGDETVFHCRLTRLPMGIGKKNVYEKLFCTFICYSDDC